MDHALVSNQTIWNTIQQLKSDMLPISTDKWIKFKQTWMQYTDCCLHKQVLMRATYQIWKIMSNAGDRKLLAEGKGWNGNNQRWSSNLCFLHVPEQADGRDILGFMNPADHTFSWWREFFNFSNHWAGPSFSYCTPSGTGPKPILIKFLNFQDILKIL